jgi:hypothetical protein
MRLLRGVLLACSAHGLGALGLGIPIAPASAQLSAEAFAYRVAPGLAGCPAREEMAAQIAAALPASAALAPPVAIDISLLPRGAGASATIVLRRSGAEVGRRELSLPAADCRELSRSVALAIAIALDPQTAPPPPAPPGPERRPPPAPPAAPGLVQQPPAPEAAASVEAEITGRVGLTVGLAPVPVPLVAAGVAVRRPPGTVQLEALFAGGGRKEVAGGQVGAWMAGGGVLPCGRAGPLSLCGGGWGAYYRAGGADLAGAREEAGLWLGLGGRASLAVMTSRAFELSLLAEGLWSVRRFRLVDSGTGATFWLMPRFAATLGVGVSAPL